MPNIRLDIEYEGQAFHGWQVQPGMKTVQGELHKALELVLREKIPVVHSSGRTDAGVHARRQVVHFSVHQVPDFYLLMHSISSILRGEVGILAARVVPDDFHSRGSAVCKQYSYQILHRIAPPTFDRGKVWHLGGQLDIERMQLEAQALVGKFDFTSFRAGDCGARSPEKTILESELTYQNDLLTYRVVGSGFLKNMVRIIVGTLVDFGRGKYPETSMAQIIAAKDRVAAGQTAPPYGLFLDWVKYPERFD